MSIYSEVSKLKWLNDTFSSKLPAPFLSKLSSFHASYPCRQYLVGCVVSRNFRKMSGHTGYFHVYKEVKGYMNSHHVNILLEVNLVCWRGNGERRGMIQVENVFQSILAGLMYYRPEDPVTFIEYCIQKIRTGNVPRLDWNSFVDYDKDVMIE